MLVCQTDPLPAHKDRGGRIGLSGKLARIKTRWFWRFQRVPGRRRSHVTEEGRPGTADHAAANACADRQGRGPGLAGAAYFHADAACGDYAVAGREDGCAEYQARPPDGEAHRAGDGEAQALRGPRELPLVGTTQGQRDATQRRALPSRRRPRELDGDQLG